MGITAQNKILNFYTSGGHFFCLTEISKNTLMLVRDPNIAIKSLFEDPNEIITDQSFLKEYKRIREISKVGQTLTETHLGTLRIFGLVEHAPNMAQGNNRLTSRGKMLKKLWNDDDKNQFEKALAKTILSNPYKKDLFKKFCEFVSRAKTNAEIESVFSWRTGGSLIAWSKLSGLIEQKIPEKYVVVKNLKSKSKPKLDEVWNEVQKSYSEIRKLGYDKKKLIIKYGDLRFRCATNFHLDDPFDFDDLFYDLMKSKRKEFINLHGTLVGDYDSLENIRYKNRLYPFISLST